VPFVRGLELSRRFYTGTVRPLLDAHFPNLPHTAARIGHGSEVQGFDTERSTDHDWGPRLHLFVGAARPDVADLLGTELTERLWGEVVPLDVWFGVRLGFDPREEVSTSDWLATPTQTLAEVTGGAVFHDDLALSLARTRLAWYPDDVWRYVLACQWRRLSQEEAFVGRSGEVGDELGSAVVAARQVRDVMRLVLLMNRRCPPYSKWLGSAFARLSLPDLRGMLRSALAATTWQARETYLAEAYTTVARMHNALSLTEPVDPATRPYHSGPYQVLHAERFAEALMATVPALNGRGFVRAIDQYVDSTDVLGHRDRSRAVAL
jgi:hypothetical protein